MPNPYKISNKGQPKLSGTIANDIEIKDFADKAKTVFTLLGKSGKNILCVYWGISLIEPEEKATVSGFVSGKVFLVQTIQRNITYPEFEF